MELQEIKDIENKIDEIGNEMYDLMKKMLSYL